MNRVLLSLGSNICPEQHLKECLRELRLVDSSLQCSSFYRTKAIGYVNQDDFLNLVVYMTTDIMLEYFIQYIEILQEKLGKNTPFPNGPRTIDIDIIDWNGEERCIRDYTIPHPRLTERRFVLEPLQEVVADWRHPLSQIHISDLIHALPDQGVVKQIH